MPGDDVKRKYHSPVRQRQAAGTRRRIRAVAEALFLRAGYGATSMRQVAAEAGVAERTLYLNFPTKAALLNEIIRVRARGHGGDDRPGLAGIPRRGAPSDPHRPAHGRRSTASPG